MKTIVFFLTLFVVSCSTGNCRRKQAPNLEEQKKALEQQFAPSKDRLSSKLQEGHVFIYKYDGSRQCQQGQPVSLESMAKELAGIQVFSQENKNDGLMHIQVCGSATGQANVYEIKKADLAAAENLGFKLWNY